VEDLEFLASLFRLDSLLAEPLVPLSLSSAKVAFVKTHVWPHAEAGTHAAWNLAHRLLTERGVDIHDVDLPEEFGNASEWRETIVAEEARAAFLPSRLKSLTLIVGRFQEINRIKGVLMLLRQSLTTNSV
jgi:Asp-tRNA(Asn)/Glu-tRNA(Gln) amidotransferase A subunit family amidase